MLNFYRSLSSDEQRSARVLIRFTVLMFTVPVAIAMTLPLFARSIGMDSNLSAVLTAATATIAVFGIAIAFGLLAYRDDGGSGESQARFIMGKSTKTE